jgi:hypothetical protein
VVNFPFSKKPTLLMNYMNGLEESGRMLRTDQELPVKERKELRVSNTNLRANSPLLYNWSIKKQISEGPANE